MSSQEIPKSLPVKGRLWKRLFLSTFIVSSLLSTIYLFQPGVVQLLTLRATDIVLGMVELPKNQLDIVVVEIDEKSIQQYGQWPWPRDRLARLLKILENGGGKSIGVNLLLSERDRTSPINWQDNQDEKLGYSGQRDEIPEKISDHDLYLAKSLEGGPFVFGYEFLFNREDGSSFPCYLEPVSVSYKRASTISGQHMDFMNFHEADNVLCNYENLTNSVHRAGFLNGSEDTDGIVRKLPLLIKYQEKLYPSFALAVLMQYLDANLLFLRRENDQITNLVIGDSHVHIDNQGYFHLGPERSLSLIHISAKEVLEGSIEPQLFNDKIVLVGLAASGITRAYRLPLARTTTLLGLHAQSIAALASELQTIRTPLFRVFEAATGVASCFLLALIAAAFSPFVAFGLCLVMVALFWMAAGLVYQNSGYLFSPLYASAALTITYTLLVAMRYRHFQVLAKNETENTLVLLRSSEKELQSILGTIPDIIFRLDRKGNITFISPAITRYVGSPGTLIGRSIFDFVDPEDLGKAQHRLNERRTGDRATFDLELRLSLAKDNGNNGEDSRYFSVTAVGIYHGNTPGEDNFAGTQGIVKDITDRKNLERQLIQAQKMEVVGNLAAGIAHDLNNILAGLVGYPDLLLMEIPKDSPLHEKILLLQKSGKKAATIVQDLLTLARRKVDVSQVCNINTIIKDYLDSVECRDLHSQHPNVTLYSTFGGSMGNVRGSSAHLSKVVMNVIHNAMEAMPDGGKITIATSHEKIETPLHHYEYIPQGDYVCFSISDTGVGIAPEDIRRIFEPFYTKRAKVGGGTGLGMTVIWATVKDHGGYIDLSSRLGQGTTLKIYLPACEAILVEKSTVRIEDCRGSETIMVVDDMVDQLEIARSMLVKLGYQVITAQGGELALQIIAKQPVDLVILDMIMVPGMSGLETYSEIKKLYPDQKAIIASGYSTSKNIGEILKKGAGKFVPKPYTIEMIGHAVREELDRERHNASHN